MLSLAHLADLHDQYKEAFSAPVADFALGPHRFEFNERPYLMGVVNLSSDSWYRESVALTTGAAVRRGRILREQGAALVDVGAESSLAHAERIDATAQSARLVPVVRELAAAGLCVSAETYHPDVASACLQAGARVINLTGTTDTDRIYRATADHDAGLILCFVQGANVRQVTNLELGRDPVGALYEHFAPRVEAAVNAGVTRLWLDPGLGFYYRNLQDSTARVRHQMRVFLEGFRLRALGWPICQALPHAFECFEDEVRSAEPFFAVLALLARTDLLRTHEIPKVRAVQNTLALGL